MLGLTVPDAIAFGMMVLGALAAWKGSTRGEHAKTNTPPENTISIGAAMFADTAAMQNMTRALNRLAEALEAGTKQQAEDKQDRIAEALVKLTEKLERK